MCGPAAIPLAMFALSVGSQVASHVAGNQAYAANKEMANLNYARASDAAQAKTVQLNAEKSEQVFDTAIATTQAEGRVASSASAQGLGFSSISHQLNTDMFGIGRQAGIEDVNDRNARAGIASDLYGAALTRKAKIESVTKPTGIGLVLGIGQAGLSALNAYKGGTTSGGSQ